MTPRAGGLRKIIHIARASRTDFKLHLIFSRKQRMTHLSKALQDQTFSEQVADPVLHEVNASFVTEFYGICAEGDG